MSIRRRDFLRHAAMIAAGIIAADQLEIIERLAPRRFWPTGKKPPNPWGDYWNSPRAKVSDGGKLVVFDSFVAVRSGYFDDPAAWLDGHVPRSGSKIFIMADTVLTIPSGAVLGLGTLGER